MNRHANRRKALSQASCEEADGQAVKRFLETGELVDSAVAARVRARTDHAREKNLRRAGFINVEELMRTTIDEKTVIAGGTQPQ